MRASALVVLAALTALPVQAQSKDPDTCGAAALQGLIDGPVPDTLPGPNPVRVYADGDAVTMDYNPNRVNIILDAGTRSIVLAVTCG